MDDNLPIGYKVWVPSVGQIWPKEYKRRHQGGTKWEHVVFGDQKLPELVSETAVLYNWRFQLAVPEACEIEYAKQTHGVVQPPPDDPMCDGDRVIDALNVWYEERGNTATNITGQVEEVEPEGDLKFADDVHAPSYVAEPLVQKHIDEFINGRMPSRRLPYARYPKWAFTAFGHHVFLEVAGVVACRPVWVCFYGLFGLLWEVAWEHGHDRPLMG